MNRMQLETGSVQVNIFKFITLECRMVFYVNDKNFFFFDPSIRSVVSVCLSMDA